MCVNEHSDKCLRQYCSLSVIKLYFCTGCNIDNERINQHQDAFLVHLSGETKGFYFIFMSCVSVCVRACVRACVRVCVCVACVRVIVIIYNITIMSVSKCSLYVLQ